MKSRLLIAVVLFWISAARAQDAGGILSDRPGDTPRETVLRALVRAQDREIAALRDALAARDVQIKSLAESNEQWRELAGARGMSKKEKLGLALSIAGSVAAVVGTVAGH